MARYNLPLAISTAEGVPDKIRSLARTAQIIAIIGITLIIWLMIESFRTAVISPDEIAEIMSFVRENIGESPDFKEAVANGIIGYPLPPSYSLEFRALFFIIPLLSSFLGLYALFYALRLFRGYRRGNIFTETSANRLARIGWSVVLLAPVTSLEEYWILKAILVTPSPLSILTSYNGHDLTLFSIVGVEQLDAFAIVIGLLMVLVGRILREATKISEENQSFI
ncbi:DUF2975 domain-containing protein [Kiloniella laminariae]|uniref:DUF2975 domain-containing protein n=1 Tax=Kiloniella laminariae TaxID=454162 RepID=UPI00038228BC|nr:DUF2975 domain-containing protein [Kiloniella laminariae]